MKMVMEKKMLEDAMDFWMNTMVFKTRVKVSNISVEGYGDDAIFTFDYSFIGGDKDKERTVDSSQLQP